MFILCIKMVDVFYWYSKVKNFDTIQNHVMVNTYFHYNV